MTVRSAGAVEILGLTSRVYGLTPREREIAELVSAGLDNRRLAARLVISRHTVNDHLKAIFAKLGVTSRRARRAHHRQHACLIASGESPPPGRPGAATCGSMSAL